MEAKLQKQIIDYFTFFEESYTTTKSRLKDCQKCAIAINKLLLRHKNIKQADLKGSPLEEYADLKSRLCDRIHNLIFELVQDIKERQSQIEDQFDKLCIKQKTFVENCREVDLASNSVIVKGSPWQPPLQQLLKFTEDTVTFGSEICALIETALSVLSIKGSDTDSLLNNFQIPKDWEKQATEIIAYTSFCSDNQI